MKTADINKAFKARRLFMIPFENQYDYAHIFMRERQKKFSPGYSVVEQVAEKINIIIDTGCDGYRTTVY